MKGFAIWFLFSVVFAIKYGVDTFECTEEGYKEYLGEAYYKIKTDMDPNHEADHHENFITNCKIMKAKNDYTAYDMDFSYLFDLSADKITELMDIAPHFTGAGSWCEEVTPIESFWDKNGRLHERKFKEEDFKIDGVSDIDTCSTSWATQAIKIAESVVKKEKDMDVKLSVKHLMKCLGPKMSLPEDPCRGYNSKDIFEFIATEGLITEEYAKELEEEADLCEPDTLKTYRFEVLEINCPNKGNLMNFIANGHHVHVMLALNLEKMRYVNEIDGESDAPFTGGTMQPTVWATVSGYQDSNDKGEDGYWKLETNVSPFETIYFKLPLRNNTNNANYAGIAGYAYGLTVDYAPTPEPTTEPPTTLPPTTLPPTTLPPTTLPPTTLPPTTEAPTTLPPTTLPPTTPAPTTLPPTTLPPPDDYIIDDASGCLDYWNEIISDPKHDQMVGTLTIKGCTSQFKDFNLNLEATYPGTDGKPTYPFARMTNLTIGDGSNTLTGLNSLSITGLESLTTIDIKERVVYESGTPKTCTAGTFLTIENNPALTTLKIGKDSMRYWCDFFVQNNAKLTYIGVGGEVVDGSWTTEGITGDCFYRADNVTIVENPELVNLHVGDRVFKSFQTFTFKNATDMFKFTVEEDSMQGRSTESGDDNIADGEVYLEDLGNFVWDGAGTSFTLVKKVVASNVWIAQNNITLTAAFQNANYDGVDEDTAGGLRQYIIEQQRKLTPAP